MHKPMCYRLLFPMLLSWNVVSTIQVFYLTGRWIAYELLRFAFLWAGIAILASVSWKMALISAALYGLLLRYDYWSNAVEFCAVACVVAGSSYGWPLAGALALGLVFGSGRETLGLLALTGTGFGIAFGLGAIAAQAIIRVFARPPIGNQLEHSVSQKRWNWHVIKYGTAVQRYYAGAYFAVAAMATISAPLLSATTVAATLALAKIDEPRVLTLLVPFAARTLCQA